IYRIKGTYSMRELGGMYAKYPLLSILMIIPFFSLVGIPPLSGFWPKLALITESIQVKGGIWLVLAILFGTFMTLFIIARMWSNVFWKSGKIRIRKNEFLYFKDVKLLHKIEMVVPIVFLAFVSLYIGFGAENIQQLSLRIADELFNSQQYIQAVLKK